MRLDFLQPLYERPGPWVSVYLDANRDTEDGAELAALRWRGLRADLEKQGAPPEALTALDAALSDVDTGVALFAAGDRVELAVPLPEPPRSDIATVAERPHALPLLVALGEPVAWVRVVADRTGADLLSSPGWRPPRADQVHASQTYPIRKAAPGGWSQPRYQRAAEENWDRNAAEVARAVAAAAEAVRAEVIVVAGDVRARQLLLDHLPAAWAPVAVQAEGSRAPGAAPEPLDEATTQAVRAAAARRRAAVLDTYHAGPSVSGAAEVADAFRQGRVGTLLLTPDGDASEDDLLCSTAGTGADLVVTEPDELPERVGAVLRW